ncbi:helix-turn-helix transcriptional regulator [Streptomyces sp. NPDC089919]|uniref:helix-turn-helix domain-containing protein n=1 Tax=Streptomyces sp. NPDC089919 TaxID=3155188 RepID=UPI00343485D5
MAIGALIRSLRDGKGWSQTVLAEHLCASSGRPTLTREDVSRWEAGKRSPGRFWLPLLAEVFSVPPEALEAAKAGHPSALPEVARQPGLWEAAGRLSVVMGMTSASLNGPSASVRWYRTAVAAADKSGCTTLRQWTRGQGALALAYEGAAPEPVVSMAGDGLALSEKPSLGRLCALLALAHAYGKLGEPSRALEALQHADEMFPSVETAEDASVFCMPRWGYSLTKTLVYARLGDVERSQAEQDTADALRPRGLGRFGAHTGVHRALSIVKSGDVGTGLDMARETLAGLPEEHRSQVLQGFVTEVKTAARVR